MNKFNLLFKENPDLGPCFFFFCFVFVHDCMFMRLLALQFTPTHPEKAHKL